MLLFLWNCEMLIRDSPFENKFLKMSHKLAEVFPTLTPRFCIWTGSVFHS